MSMTKIKGFTIIETVLFLGITGLLITGMIVGVGSSITVQRYKDSVTTLKSFLQGQYSELNNVTNTRDGTWRCDTATGKTLQSGIPEPLGQSQCVLLGRYITISGSDQTVAQVTGYPKPAGGTGSDINILKTGYVLGLSTVDQASSVMEWGSQIAWPAVVGPANPVTDIDPAKNPTTPRSIAILIIRSPDSGLVYTFTVDSPPVITSVDDTYLQSMLAVGNTGNGSVASQKQRILCVDPGGIVFTTKTGVYIHEYATNENSIETRSNDVIKSLGSNTQC